MNAPLETWKTIFPNASNYWSCDPKEVSDKAIDYKVLKINQLLFFLHSENMGVNSPPAASSTENTFYSILGEDRPNTTTKKIIWLKT